MKHQNRAPYIMAAFFCDKVLRESDNVLSAIRIVDIVYFPPLPEGLPAGTKPLIQMTLLLGVKSGALKGEYTLTVRVIRPDGETGDTIMSLPLTLAGDNAGQNYILTVAVGVHQEGLHWFEVVFEDEVLTAIPLTILSSKPGQEMLPGQISVEAAPQQEK